MTFHDLPIKGKVTAIMVLTSVVVLLLTAAAFTLYDLYSYRKAMVDNLSITAATMAESSVPALVTTNEVAANNVLAAFRANSQVELAALYDLRGELLGRYPSATSQDEFPAVPRPEYHLFSRQHLVIFHPIWRDQQRVGTLFVQANTRPIYDRLRQYAGIALFVLLGSAAVAWAIAHALQRRITSPILSLADTAKRVAERGDYSARAPTFSGDELGLLTDVFNRMLQRIEENRARLSGIINSAMDAIITVDASQRITAFNAAAESMFGCSAESAIGTHLDRFIPARFRPAHQEHVQTFGQNGVTARAMGQLRTLYALHSNGGEFPIEASISQIEVAGQKFYTVILRDVTERLEAQQRILDLNAELERRVEARTAELIASNKELEAFTYSVAHDLRAPLRHIESFSRILQEDFAPNLPEEARAHLQTIQQGSRNMSRLVDDLLNLARVGRTEAKYQQVSLGTLVDQVRTDLKRETEGRNIQWHLQPLPVVECDPGLMKQVFANLVSNAIKYTRPRPVAVIEIGLDRQNGLPAVYIRDNGVGFNMKYVDKLFGVFQRLHRTEEFEGTGVGLALADRIIRKHGGRIWAHSEQGRGAVFRFTLPALADARIRECTTPPEPVRRDPSQREPVVPG